MSLSLYKEEIDEQVARLTRLLDEAAHRTRQSRRSLERQLGLAHGYFGNLFRGRTELKVYHVLLLAKILDLDPVDLLRRALTGEDLPPATPPRAREPEETAAPPPARSAEADKRPSAPAPELDLDRLQELIRKTFRDEVRKLGGNLAKMSEEP